MVDVYICGCSFSTGFYKKSINPLVAGRNAPYAELFCFRKIWSYVNLAFNGASNYAIAKQVEYAITRHPKLIIVNITTPMRIDWTPPQYRLTRKPTLADIVYNDVPVHPLKPAGSGVRSLPISTYLSLGNPSRVFVDYMTEFVDPQLKADTDRLIVLGMFSLLKESGIPFIAVNFSEELGQNLIPDIHDITWRDLATRFPVATDSTHFNQAGHMYMSKLLETSLPKLVDLN